MCAACEFVFPTSEGPVDLMGMGFDINFGSSWYSAYRFVTHTVAWRRTP